MFQYTQPTGNTRRFGVIYDFFPGPRAPQNVCLSPPDRWFENTSGPPESQPDRAAKQGDIHKFTPVFDKYWQKAKTKKWTSDREHISQVIDVLNQL
jgi:hypothetical protein